MLIPIAVTGALVLAGYVAGGRKLPWRGLERHKAVWAVSVVATVTAYLYLFVTEVEPLLLLVFNCFALLWGWAYALFGDPWPLACVAVVGTGAVAATLLLATGLAGDPLPIAASAMLAAHHIGMDCVLWIRQPPGHG